MGRLALVGVLIVLVYLYVSAGVSLLSTWHASQQDGARVAALKRQNAALKGEHARLRRGYEAEAQARALGMGRPGEKEFVVSHLPRN